MFLKHSTGFGLFLLSFTLLAYPVRCSVDCKTTPSGTEYLGLLNQTKSGLVCQRWADDFPHKPNGPSTKDSNFPDGSRVKASNYCRSPDQDPNGPWCYTISRRKRWEYCDIPRCEVKIRPLPNVDGFGQRKVKLPIPCPEPFTKVGDHCYYLAKDGIMKWNNAKARCIAMGGYLAELETHEEIELVKDYLTSLAGRACSSFLGPSGRMQRVFIGAEQSDLGAFFWSQSRKPVFHFDWYSGQPDRLGSRNSRVTIDLSCLHAFQWDDNDYYTNEQYYLCEADLVPSFNEVISPNSPPKRQAQPDGDRCPPGQERSGNKCLPIQATTECPAPGILWNGNCYMYFERPKPFWRAARECERKNGRLADITQGKEVVQKLWETYGRTAVEFGDLGFWVGAHTRRYPGSWFCNSPATCLQYWNWFVPDESVWAPREPNNVATDEGCAVVRADGLWDQPCTLRMGYVCQMDRKLSSEGCSGPFPDIKGAKPDKSNPLLQLEYNEKITYTCSDGEEIVGTCRGILDFEIEKGICTSLIGSQAVIEAIRREGIGNAPRPKSTFRPPLSQSTTVRVPSLESDDSPRLPDSGSSPTEILVKGTELERLNWLNLLTPTADGSDLLLEIPNGRKFQIGFSMPDTALDTCRGPSGFGECRYLRHCVMPEFTDSVSNFEKYICFHSKYVGVCCHRQDKAPYTDVSATNCESLNSDKTCGERSSLSKRIAGGEPAKPRDWPWAAALFQRSNSRGEVFICGGVLLSRRHVLTAAHCVMTDAKNLIVRLGEFNFTDGNATTYSIDAGVEKIILHENYNSRDIHNDIAIIVLEKLITYTCDIWYVCYPVGIKPFNLFGRTAMVIGWGADGVAARSNVLNQVQVNIYSERECDATLQQYRQFYSARSMICARARDGPGDSCQGDSGGPLMIEENGSWYVIGIVSAGEENCGSTTLPGVYTRVDRFTSWITNTISAN